MSVITAHAARIHTPALELKVRWDGITYVDESSRVVSATGIESMSDVSLPHPREATLVLDNTDDRYTPGETSSSIHAWTTHVGQSVTLRLGYDTATTGGWAKVGTYVLRELALDADERTATAVIRDAVEDYALLTTSIEPAAATLTSLATALLTAAGVSASAYSIDTLASSAVLGYASAAGLLDELWQVAIAEGGRVYLDEEGILKVQSRANRQAALRAPVATLTASEVAYKSGAVRRADRANRISLSFEDRTLPAVPQTLFSLSNPVSVMAAVTTNVQTLKAKYQPHYDPGSGTIHPGDPMPPNPADAYDITASFGPGQAFLQVKFQDTGGKFVTADADGATFTVTANTAADGSGTAVTANKITDLVGQKPTASGTDIKYWWSGAGVKVGTWQAPPQLVIFFNTRSEIVWVRQFDIATYPASQASGGYDIVVDDAGAIEANGGRIVERRVSSAYLPDQATARERAADLLFFLTASRDALDIPDLDGVPFLRPGDAFRYVDDTVTPSVTYDLQVLENRWTYQPEGGYTASLVTMPALTQTDLDATPVAMPAPTLSAATTTRTGPFKWGADANALVWDETTWG